MTSSLPQHPDGDKNTTVSVIQNMSEERSYSIRSWLAPRKGDTVSEEKRDPGHLKRVEGTMTACFMNTEGLKSKLQNTDFLDLLEKMI